MKLNVRLHNQYNDFLDASSICSAIFSECNKSVVGVLHKLTEKSGLSGQRERLKQKLVFC